MTHITRENIWLLNCKRYENYKKTHFLYLYVKIVDHMGKEISIVSNASLSLPRDFRPSLGATRPFISSSSLAGGPIRAAFRLHAGLENGRVPTSPQCHTRGDKHFPALKIETGKSPSIPRASRLRSTACKETGTFSFGKTHGTDATDYLRRRRWLVAQEFEIGVYAPAW